ncbi:MAG: hypothetical protein KGZ63_11345 [Clostridiales bacterium]|jgi:hypothetical protein|nr:hypothetical protein [Clostridiales bacterium]
MKIFGQKELPKKYQKSFLKGLKSGAAQVRSDTPCIVMDEVMPEKIVQASDQDILREKATVKIKYGKTRKASVKRKIV